jgi:flagellar hook assembly protein FlgD
VLSAVALVCALALQLFPGSLAIRPVKADGTAVPKAVFIVGPSGGTTDMDLVDAEKMAQQAEMAGMEVHRVFYPHATWENVLANIQDANLVVYMGHGYGYPSPYQAVLTESRQNGMGLNTYDGSGKNEYTYYGATRLKESIHLAANAIVYLNHLCYSAGNGEPGAPIPELDIARQRVDNMAAGWLSIGARAVFAYDWFQRLNMPAALMTTDQTMDQLFMTPATGAMAGSPSGFIGWNESRFDSQRTPGATNHLDPHPRYGYWRAVTGDLNFTTTDFRASATGTPGAGGVVGDPGPPEIIALSAGTSGGAGLVPGQPSSFHPNGDGIDDSLVVTHTVTRAAFLDAVVTDASGQLVRTYSVWSLGGTTTSIWNGKNDAGAIVPDGTYTLTYTPRDAFGVTGSPAAVTTLVLTAISLKAPSPLAFLARDGDALSKTEKLKVQVLQPATVSWQILDEAGNVVRTAYAPTAVAAGLLKFVWDGLSDAGAWAPDGWYRSVVTATTALGTYSQERRFYVGAFRITPSADVATRGGTLTLTIVSTEPLSAPPVVHVTQPGVATFDVAASAAGKKKYRVTITLDPGGDSGQVILDVAGTDKKGGAQDTAFVLDLG